MKQVGKSLMGGSKDYKAFAEQVKRAGYKGEKVVILRTADQAQTAQTGPILLDVLKRIGLNADMQDVDLATLFVRRQSRAPTSEGGWSMFVSFITTALSANPVVDPVTRGIGLPNGYVGDSNDPQLETLIAKWIEAVNETERNAMLTKIQERLFEMAWTLPLGSYKIQTAFRSNLTG